MTVMPQPRLDHSEPAVPSLRPAETIPSPSPASLADAISKASGAPPHLLWATLESAYAQPDSSPAADEERLAPYIALPMALGLSLVLWVVIVELVLMR